MRRALLLVVVAAALAGCQPDTDLRAAAVVDPVTSDLLERFEARGHPCTVDPHVRIVGDGVLCEMAGVDGNVSLFHDTRAEQRRRLAACADVGAIAGRGWTILVPAQDGLADLAADLGGRSACG